MNILPKINLYGSSKCHKTLYYKNYLESLDLPYEFLDVVVNLEQAEELKNLYENRRLNFPTITIGDKKLRNPNDKELNKWLNKFYK
jgi:glutaredoxin-related protein